MVEVLMPALSPEMEQGAVNRWLVKPGDRVSPGDVLVEIETDKATIEVLAEHTGVVTRLLIPEGTEGVRVDTPIAEIELD